MKQASFKETVLRVASRHLGEPTVKSVTMQVGTSDEWAILNIHLAGDWPRPHGETAEKELAQVLYEKASKLPSWASALSRVPRTVETVDEYATAARDDDDDDDDGYRREREPVMQETTVPRPRSWRDIEDWTVQADRATFTLTNRN